MTKELADLKLCLDDLLRAHDEFDSAMRDSDHNGMLAAQARIEDARLSCAESSRRFEDSLNEFKRLERMMGE